MLGPTIYVPSRASRAVPASASRASRRALLAAALLTGGVLACGDDSTAPTSGVAGSYAATTMTRTPSGGSAVDVLAAGGSLTIQLKSDGTTTGQLVIPASLNGGQQLTASMAGTWTQTGSTVTFSQSADTFVRDMPFTVAGSTLQGDKTFGSDRVVVVLTRQ